ncbi:ABC transporter substrate-binding protein [Paraburkholderia silvatlantica]|uniref:NitT/TauT family transport system substrate-binding protein n=2 Tax=Paraburkholderia silvatlantica TaxID=321895 RepID=A0A2U1A897_9BURK|nr:ABC transporter substrate-binding protein [Paraburkholderia silvatlantica]PVY28752.1 NitT/TauT family transport system substrate-binding protein [Paraburkholderia silvatlantica]PXW36389.1 NitT/TauT family transport system substrate-binding protein [Paraburkholderia silvatlantica]PYE21714.1 NitT/TauT family transport system substrate-binding protein [Paraburkholderia silvatlantica]TDQ86836.1 NitT/TauT family transport system substrate-binding protein [Paraburkholderia silvatlantica]
MCNVPMSRREWLKLASLFTVAGAAPLLKSLDARAAADPDAPVRIGYLPITDATPLLVAHNNGYFDAAGIQAEKPTLLRSWAQLVEAFLSGQVNVVHLLSPMTVWARYGSKAPAKVVAWNHVNGSALTVSPGVSTVADLGGKTVAVPFWYSVHNVVLQDMLRAQGLTPVLKHSGTPGPKEVNLIVMAPSDMPPALASNQIAGYIVAEPFNAAAEQLNIGKILRFTGDVWRNHACCVIFMHEQDLTQRAAWSQKVVDAIVKAQLWTRANPQDAAKLLSKEGPNHYTPHAPQLLARVLAPQAADQGRYLGDHAIQHADWNSKRIDFQPYPYPSYTEELVRRLKATQVEGASQFLASLDPKQVASDLVDDRFVKKSIEASGGLAAFGQDAGYSRKETIVV